MSRFTLAGTSKRLKRSRASSMASAVSPAEAAFQTESGLIR